MTILLISLFSISIISYLGYRVWFLAGALADQQDVTDEVSEYVQALETTNSYMYERIEKTYNAMAEIDRIGAFEKDDEAGTTFQLLKQVVDELYEEFKNGEKENQ